MCGRYYIDQEDDIAEMRKILDEINQRFYGDDKLRRMRTGEIFPTNIVPVLRQNPDNNLVVPDLMLWGFPHFKGKGVIINARAETAAAKPMFRQAVKTGRILIPASAFFEWDHEISESGKPGQKFKVSWKEEPTFYMAGLFHTYPDPKVPDKTIDSFVILTTDANTSVAGLHNRMPLILPRRLLRTWIGDEAKTGSILQHNPEMELVLAKTA